MRKKMLSVMAVGLSAAVALAACSSASDTTGTTDTTDTASAPASNSAGGEVEREARETETRSVAIVNNTNRTMTIAISGTDNFDWESRRPDHPAPEGFQGAVLTPGETVTHTLTVNNNAEGSPFTVNFGDTGASVRLKTYDDLAYQQINPDPPYDITRFWGGWNGEAPQGGCVKRSIESAGYLIVTECDWGRNLAPGGVHTRIEITTK